MPSNGAGVNKDNAGTPVRITFYDITHADAQNDGLGNTEYDLHKIWACMGRNGVNGILRTGFVEVGNPFTGSGAGWIEPYHLAASGGAQWDQLTAYDPIGGAAVGDYCLYGALEPFSGFMLHLDAALGGQPVFAADYYTTGGVWTPFYDPTAAPGSPLLTGLTIVPDFTQANGRANQRVQWTVGNLSPQWIPSVQGLSGNPFYFIRLRRLAVDAYGAPAANINYKDFLYGHFKRYWCEFDLKRGDDTAGSSPTNFRDEGPWHLAFRHGFGFDGARANQAQPIQFGRKVTTGTRKMVVYPWVLQQNTKKTMRNPAMYGGAVVGIGDTTATVSWLKGGPIGEILACFVSGFQNIAIGTAGAGTLDEIEDLIYVANPAGPRGIAGISTNAGSGLVIHHNQNDPGLTNEGSIRVQASPATMAGGKFTDDRYGSGNQDGQLYKSSTGRLYLVDWQWGGANKKIADASIMSVNNEIVEVRRVHVSVFEDGTTTPPPAGMNIRMFGSDGVMQVDDVLDINGGCDFQNLLGNPFAGTPASYRFIWASVWRTTNVATEEKLDEYLKIVVNDPLVAGYNYDYVTLTTFVRCPRGLWYNQQTPGWERPEWQRADFALSLGLQRRAVTPATTDDIPVDSDTEELVVSDLGG